MLVGCVCFVKDRSKLNVNSLRTAAAGFQCKYTKLYSAFQLSFTTDAQRICCFLLTHHFTAKLVLAKDTQQQQLLINQKIKQIVVMIARTNKANKQKAATSIVPLQLHQ